MLSTTNIPSTTIGATLTDGEFKYDVFLSYNKSDKQQVHALADKLVKAGVRLFLDDWHLKRGKQFQPGLEQGLRDSKTFAIFFSKNRISPWQDNEVQIAINIQTDEKRNTEYEALQRHAIPVFLPGDYDAPIPQTLGLNSWVNYREAKSPEDEQSKFIELLSGIFDLTPEQARIEFVSPSSTCPLFRFAFRFTPRLPPAPTAQSGVPPASPPSRYGEARRAGRGSSGSNLAKSSIAPSEKILGHPHVAKYRTFILLEEGQPPNVNVLTGSGKIQGNGNELPCKILSP